MKRLRDLIAAIAACLLAATGASAATLNVVTMVDGGTYSLSPDTVYTFTTLAQDTDGDVTFGFDSPFTATALGAGIFFDPFTSPLKQATMFELIWSSAPNGGGTVFGTTGPISLVGGVGGAQLGTLIPPGGQQWFTATFDGREGAGAFSAQVISTTSPVPLPAAAPLLAAALLGLTLFRRRTAG